MRLLDVGCGWGGMLLHAARAPRRARRGRHAVAAARPSWPTKRVAEAGLADRSRSASRTTATSTTGRSTRSARSACSSTSGWPSSRPTSPACYALLRARRAPAQPRHQPPGSAAAHRRRPATADGAAAPALAPRIDSRSSTATCSPTASCTRSARGRRAMQETGFEVRHVESLREHYALTLRRWVAQPRGQLGRRRGRGRPGPGPGLAALHGRVGARLRGRQHPDPPGAGGARPTGAAAACRCGPGSNPRLVPVD